MSPLRLYNTLGRKLEDFQPMHGQEVGLYTCGPTVYNTAHIGNLRTYIFEDVLRRTLALNGYTAKHVMNITDVGHLTGDDGDDSGVDKIAKAAKETKRDAYVIAKQYETEFFTDTTSLNILPPTVKLRATETIDAQIKLIEQLEKNGFTYTTSDGIYFDTAKLPTYGQLSGQKTTEKQAGARVEVNTEKRNPTDFALWKFSDPADQRQMEWDAFGKKGFPGWHIECSAMSLGEFPNGLDIHCGGIDHIAVHHENEIAQNEAAGHKDFVNIWMHGEFLVLPSKRMGKSEGNSILLHDVVAKGINPLAYRYLCLQAHYRKPLSFTWESLEAAAQGLNNIWATIDHAESSTLSPAEADSETIQKFTEAVNNDLNTAQALAVMQELLSSDMPWNMKLATLSKIDEVLGLNLLGKRESAWITPTPAQQNILDQRQQARTEKDWSMSDALRDELLATGFEVVDDKDGQRLRKK